MNWKLITIVVGVVLASIVSVFYTASYHGRILPGVHVGGVLVGGLSHTQAEEVLSERIRSLTAQGVTVSAGNKQRVVLLEDIGAQVEWPSTLDEAWNKGRNGAWYQRVADWVVVPLTRPNINAPVTLNNVSLQNTIDDLNDLLGTSPRDIRLHVTNTNVEVLTDIKTGLAINPDEFKSKLMGTLSALFLDPITLSLHENVPHADIATAPEAQTQAQWMLSAPLVLKYEDRSFVVSREKIGEWVDSTYDGDRLVPNLDQEQVSAYVTTVALALNVTPRKATFDLVNGRVTNFVPPRPGQAVEEEKMIGLINETILQRRTRSISTAALAIPVKVTRPVFEPAETLPGISEIIGRATTPFTGSPSNRISNIKNGVRFLTGLVVKPGEEFSTLAALGTIDNTTGYLPELVIKGDQTVPEFGGGLCQVSTTLFRALLNSGLPITARQNHSYRVSYYEKDGTGRYIGPGLDATIYSPNPDLKFKNDTGAPILIIGYVEGDRVSFELYGTSDGRTSHIDGPRLLSEFPAGDPIYADTDTLPVGVTKQIEKAHPGGSAVANYTVTYADGHKASQEFRSYYRRWPARYLVGTAGAVLPSTLPTITPTGSVGVTPISL